MTVAGNRDFHTFVSISTVLSAAHISKAIPSASAVTCTMQSRHSLPCIQSNSGILPSWPLSTGIASNTTLCYWLLRGSYVLTLDVCTSSCCISFVGLSSIQIQPHMTETADVLADCLKILPLLALASGAPAEQAPLAASQTVLGSSSLQI